MQPHVTSTCRISAGVWRFALDRCDEGVNQQWFAVRLPEYIKLPGILQAQNQGDEITTKTPWVLSLYDRFWYLREEYKDYTETERQSSFPVSAAAPLSRRCLVSTRYQSSNPNWVSRRVVLTLERPHWETTVWLDNKKIGSDTKSGRATRF